MYGQVLVNIIDYLSSSPPVVTLRLLYFSSIDNEKLLKDLGEGNVPQGRILATVGFPKPWGGDAPRAAISSFSQFTNYRESCVNVPSFLDRDILNLRPLITIARKMVEAG